MGRQHVHVAVTAGLAVALATGGFPTAAVAETLGIKKDEASQTASEPSVVDRQGGGLSSSSDETVVAGDERHDAKAKIRRLRTAHSVRLRALRPMPLIWAWFQTPVRQRVEMSLNPSSHKRMIMRFWITFICPAGLIRVNP